jgi:hypothetical protein
LQPCSRSRADRRHGRRLTTTGWRSTRCSRTRAGATSTRCSASATWEGSSPSRSRVPSAPRCRCPGDPGQL